MKDADDFEAGVGLVADPDGQPQRVASVRPDFFGARCVLREAGVEHRHAGDRVAHRVDVDMVFHARRLAGAAV